MMKAVWGVHVALCTYVSVLSSLAAGRDAALRSCGEARQAYHALGLSTAEVPHQEVSGIDPHSHTSSLAHATHAACKRVQRWDAFCVNA